ncbi:MAG: tripartite tricarboxylate transporter permease [Candidatus Pacearchaeota archaeon]|nr:tripartite tricarboxylate transporter permease [Candidatus Pacearchaeota archaeon]
MIIEILIALLLGVAAGTFTGLSPGIHINLISSILVSSLYFFSSLPPTILLVFIVAMSITHTFIDFIPSIFLGAPEEDSFLSILPGHQMLLEGKGFEAYIITIYGSLTALIIILIFTPIFIIALPPIYKITKTIIPFLLIFISLFIIFREKNYFLSLVIFLLSGILGFLTFNLPIKEPLMPLLSGLFGLSSLIISIKTKSNPQKQEVTSIKNIKLTKSEFTRSIIPLFIFSPFCSFLPGIGSSHSATISSEIFPQNNRSFLFLVGATNTIIMGLSFITLYTINKSRSGSAAAIQEILNNITIQHIILIIITIIISGIIASIIGIKIAKYISTKINKINYAFLTIITALIILTINIIFSNWLGILVLIIATSLGIFTITLNSKRINLMGSLIIPAITHYLIA